MFLGLRANLYFIFHFYCLIKYSYLHFEIGLDLFLDSKVVEIRIAFWPIDVARIAMLIMLTNNDLQF